MTPRGPGISPPRQSGLAASPHFLARCNFNSAQISPAPLATSELKRSFVSKEKESLISLDYGRIISDPHALIGCDA